MFSGVLEVIKRGSWPTTSSGSPSDIISLTQDCKSLSPNYAIDSKVCPMAESLNYILSCYQSEYLSLAQIPVIANTVKNTTFCHQMAQSMCSTPDINDSLVYDTVCNNSYICVMLSPKHVLAMCFMEDPSIVQKTVPCDADQARMPENFSSTSSEILADKKKDNTYKTDSINASTVDKQSSTSSKSGKTNGIKVQPSSSSSDQKTPDQSTKQEKTKKRSSSETSDQEVESKSKSKNNSNGNKDSSSKQKSSKEEQQISKERETTENLVQSVSTEEEVQPEGSGYGEEYVVDSPENGIPTPSNLGAAPIETNKQLPHSHSNKESVIVRLSNKIKVSFF